MSNFEDADGLEPAVGAGAGGDDPDAGEDAANAAGAGADAGADDTIDMGADIEAAIDRLIVDGEPDGEAEEALVWAKGGESEEMLARHAGAAVELALTQAPDVELETMVAHASDEGVDEGDTVAQASGGEALVITPEQRFARGKDARRVTPRSVHGGWEPGPRRLDPIALLEEQAQTRVPELIPIRYGRMLASPFAFYRGAALIMAADLAATPVTGFMTQLCGDAHLANEASKWTAFLVILAAPGALYLVIDALPRIELEYLFFFNWSNLLFLWVTIGVVKLVHEFAHAYVAKRFGLHVPEMGIAFLIFFPCLYCNTTEAWQLANPRQRASIAGAGIVAEAVVAVFSTYLWYYTQPGLVNSLAFYLMAISFASTILFNGNPLLKFDGYFILIDMLALPNLATNSCG